MAVICKFQLHQKSEHKTTNADGEEVISSVGVQFGATYADNDPHSENSQFWQATPSGQLQMTVNNPACFTFFKPGKKYYIRLEEAPD